MAIFRDVVRERPSSALVEGSVIIPGTVGNLKDKSVSLP